MVESPRKRRATSAHCSTPPRPKQATPKSLTVTQMIKLGKLIKPSGETIVVDIYPFDFTTLSWSMLTRKVEFTIEKKSIGEGGFRKAFKASSTCPGFSGQTWVFKRYLESVVKEIEGDLGQSMDDHTKKVIQMHNLSKKFADQLAQTIKDKNVSELFGPVVQFEEVHFGKLQETGECITIEKFIEGTFEKYINNTGELCVPEANLVGQKAACLAHFSYEKSNKQLMVLDLQGSGHLFHDPEIASTELVGKDNEYMFCAGNLSTNAITTFFDNRKWNMFWNLIGLE